MGCHCFNPGRRWLRSPPPPPPPPPPSSSSLPPQLLLLLLVIVAVGNSHAQQTSNGIGDTTTIVADTSIGVCTSDNDDEIFVQQRLKNNNASISIHDESYTNGLVGNEEEQEMTPKKKKKERKSIKIPTDFSDREIVKFIKKRFKYLLGDKKKMTKDKSQLPLPLKSPLEYGEFYNQCMTYEDIEDDGYEGWQLVDSPESSYQEMDFYFHPSSNDICLALDGYLHVCMSQRSHYHELFVHYPAKYLSKVERVLFLGGGDSMVLDEVLKYSGLELVVGLELDQKVTRQSFKYFGTQPHFHRHKKVQWWFGDAAQSMKAIPTEYYGSFDLVVVDLVTVVHQNLMVGPNLSLMDAAMMMLKPDTGIIVKNDDEFYVPGSTHPQEFPHYRADVLAYDFPTYCIQTFVMGSHTVDFETTNLNLDHPMMSDGKMLYLQDGDFRSQFDTWYTTGERTTTTTNVVEEENKEGEEEDEDSAPPSAGSTTTGLVVIIEAEQIGIPTLESYLDIQEIFNKKTTNLGFRSIASLPPQELNGGYTLISLLEEGCITARCFPSKQYCAIDVQLWRNLEKAEILKMELLSALQSEESSVYRIITTGIVGVEEQTNDKIGPPPSPSNQNTKTATSESNVAPVTQKEEDDNEENSSQSSPDEIPKTVFRGRKETKLEYMTTSPFDYDSTSALEQWESQEPLGSQRIVKHTLLVDEDNEKSLSKLQNKKSLSKLLKRRLKKALTKASEKWENKDKDQIFVASYDVGNGLVAVATWSEGTIVVLWDGVSRVDMNCFSLEGTSTIKRVLRKFEKYLEYVEHDMFPRGMGRVVNFRKDFEIATDNEVVVTEEGQGQRRRRFLPYWARRLSKDSDKERT